MILDNNLVFSTAQSMNITTSTPSESVIDLTGGATLEIGNASAFGADLGIGDGVAIPKIGVWVGSQSIDTTNSATLNIAFQGNASASSAADANWITYIETGALAAARLDAYAKIAAFDWPLKQVEAAMPRYVRLYYQVATGVFTTGEVNAYVMLQRDDWTLGLYPSGFSVGA